MGGGGRKFKKGEVRVRVVDIESRGARTAFTWFSNFARKAHPGDLTRAKERFNATKDYMGNAVR